MIELAEADGADAGKMPIPWIYTGERASDHQALLRAAIATSGLSVTRYASDVLTRDPRTVRRWLAGASPIPQAVIDHLRRALS